MVRRDTRLASALAAAVLAGVAFIPAASARNAAPSQADALGTCQRAVSRIGAQMGHTQHKNSDGGDSFVFVVRSDGGEYAVRCDGATGTLGAIESCWKRASSTCLAQASGSAHGE